MRQVRSALARGAHDELVALLRGGTRPDHSLQLVGDALLGAVRADTDHAATLARDCIAQLQQRDWEGDRELVEALVAALGDGPTPMLRPLPVDLEELSMVLEGDPLSGGGRVDLATGEVWPQAAIDYAVEIGEIEEDDDDPDRWLWVDCVGSRPGYRDMEWFIADLDEHGEGELAGRLERAISGRGAFRRFKDRLWDRSELMELWHSFSDDRQCGRARAWLAAEGYRPVRPPNPGR